MNLLDLTLALVVVAAAAGFLVWQLALRRRQPACHPSRRRARNGGVPGGPTVVLDRKLARALAKAKAKRS